MSSLGTMGHRAKRRFDKEFYGDEIAHKLNGATLTPGVARVRTLIERLKAFTERSVKLEIICREQNLMASAGVQIFSDSPLCHYKLDYPEVSELADQLQEIAGEIGLQLGRYHWRPDVRLTPEGTLSQFTRWRQFNEESAWENETVQWLISELPTSPQGTGAFAHFAHCERCGDWFYAGRDGARFCRAACRVASHAQTDEGRSERAAYMRNLRKLKREREQQRYNSRSQRVGTQSVNPSKPSRSKSAKKGSSYVHL